MKYLATLTMLMLASCVSQRDPLTYANLEHTEEIWYEDKVPTVPDEEWEAMSDEDKKRHMSMSKHLSREYFFTNSLYYEFSKPEK